MIAVAILTGAALAALCLTVWLAWEALYGRGGYDAGAMSVLSGLASGAFFIAAATVAYQSLGCLP